MFIVYVLFSEKSGKHYTGFSSDLTGRLLSHDQLGKGLTSNHRPWKLIYQKPFDTKRDAILYERWLKTGAGRDFIKMHPH